MQPFFFLSAIAQISTVVKFLNARPAAEQEAALAKMLKLSPAEVLGVSRGVRGVQVCKILVRTPESFANI